MSRRPIIENGMGERAEDALEHAGRAMQVASRKIDRDDERLWRVRVCRTEF